MPILNIFSDSNNNNCNCGCNRNIIVRRRNTTTIQNARIAEFTTVGSQLINSNSIIPFTNTQYNNISTNVQLNNDGTVTLLTQGVYKLEYVTVVQNTSDASIDASFLLQSDGVNLNLTLAKETLESDQFGTVTNQIIIPVFSGTTRTISLLNATSEAVLIVNANIVVTKLI